MILMNKKEHNYIFGVFMWYKFFVIYIVFGFFQLIFCSIEIDAQNWNSLLPYLNEKDKGVVDNAISSLKDAGDLINQANEYYNNALKLQSNYDLDEETLQKKLSKEESKAISTQLKADKIYSEANKTVLEICLKVLKEKG
jgi:hypothetical protein